MGFFGGGNSSSNTTVSTQDYTATVAPQADLSGSAGASSIQIAPVNQGSSGGAGSIYATSSSFFAPVTNTPSVNYGDAAVALAQKTAQTSLQASQIAQTSAIPASGTSTVPTWLSGLFSAPIIYYLLGGLVLLMFYRGHHK